VRLRRRRAPTGRKRSIDRSNLLKTALKKEPGCRNANCLGTKFWKPSAGVWLAVLLAHLGLASAQTPAELDLQMYAGLSITGAVGTVYQLNTSRT